MQRKLAIFLAVLILLFPKFIFSQEQFLFYSEKIKNFDVEITINKDSSLLIKESILYDFGENLKHGIYRDIPIDGIKIKVIKVVDEISDSYPFKISRAGKYLRIKIGDPNKIITGEHTYNIFYQVQRGLRYFKDHDELYWNVTGNEWEVPIEESSAWVYLPEKISEKELKLDCFTGTFGSRIKNCSFKIDENGNIYFESEKSFYPREGLTIVFGWPKGIINTPNFFQKCFWALGDFLHLWPLLIPIFTFIFLFKEWWQKGKDPRIKKTIIAQYEPPDNLKPAQVSLILNQKVQPKDISATLIDLAVGGFIKIKEIKKPGIFGRTDYEIIKLKDFKENLWEYEKELLESLFGSKETVMISNLKNKFYTHLTRITNETCQEVTSGKYFVSNPKKAKLKWIEMGVGMIFLGLVLAAILENHILAISTIISGVLFFIFSPFMPKRTEKGTEAYWKILGFKEYINTAEKYRVQFQEKENIFEKYLPYAIIFGLVDKWAKAFEGIYTTPPSWYEGDFGLQFTTYNFVHSLNLSLSNANSAFISRPGGRTSGFGGGGFSGGGGGGGGGGSW